MKNTNLIIMILIGVVALGAGFFGGMQYQKSQVTSFQPRNSNGQNFRQNTVRGNGAVRGQILSSDDKSVTVKLNDGSSKIVLVGSTTAINQAAPATIKDLTSGKTVAVFGTTNPDGTVTAQNIQLNPVTPTRPTQQ